VCFDGLLFSFRFELLLFGRRLIDSVGVIVGLFDGLYCVSVGIIVFCANYCSHDGLLFLLFY